MSDNTHNTFTCPYCHHTQRYMSDETPDFCCDEREQAEEDVNVAKRVIEYIERWQ